MPVVEFIKRHPIAVGAGVIVGGIILLSGFSGSSSTSTGNAYYANGTDPATVQAGLALQQMQYQMQGASMSAQYQYQAQADTNASNLAVAQLSAGVQNNANTLGAQVAQAQIDAAAKSTDLANTLQSQAAIASLQTQEQIAALGANIQHDQINAMLSMHLNDNATLQAVTGIQANQATSLASIYSNANVQSAQINASVQQAQIKAGSKGLFSQIFS